MRLIILVVLLLITIPVNATTTKLYGGVDHTILKGKVLNKVNKLQAQKAVQDYRAPLPFKLAARQLRGYLGASFDPHSGELTSIFANSDLNRLGVKAGAYIIKINKALYRPCLMTNVASYYANDYISLTLREGDHIREVIVKLKDSKTLFGTDNAPATKEREICEPRK